MNNPSATPEKAPVQTGEGSREETREGSDRPCPGCGGFSDCGMQAGRDTCWCFTLPHVIRVPDTKAKVNPACLCEKCLRALIASSEDPQETPS